MRSVAIAHALIRLYPRAWRVRYEGELRALVQDHPPSLAQLVDLLRGCGSEWGRLLTDPVAYPRLSAEIDAATQICYALLFGIFVVGAGELLRNWRQPPLTPFGISVASFVHLALILRVLPIVTRRRSWRRVGVLEAWLWLATVTSTFLLDRWSGVGIPFPAIDVIRAASCLWCLSMATPASAKVFDIHSVQCAARRDEYRIRLGLETAERYANDAPAEIEIARTALADVRGRIRRHADELRRIPLLSLIGLRKP